jgi:putative transposase
MGGMRGRRIKVCAEEEEAVYHCMSRTVNGEFLFGDAERECLRRQIWLVADYCGVQVLTYTVLSNHFHVLVRVPRKTAVPDSELLRRYERLYPTPTKYQTARLEVIKDQLSSNGPEAVQWRNRQLRLMGDVSSYLKLLKQRFSIWFNRTHRRYGTLWAERFKSVVVEPGGALQTMGVYIELNCVRAGLAKDPKNYRFCGYAEAVAGEPQARAGIEFICGETWSEAARGYRKLIFGTGLEARQGKAAISPEAFEKVMQRDGTLSAPELLRCRLRFLSDSGILGSQAFVRHWVDRLGLRRRPSSRNGGSSALGLSALRTRLHSATVGGQ